jgi:hypothetical protein
MWLDELPCCIPLSKAFGTSSPWIREKLGTCDKLQIVFIFSNMALALKDRVVKAFSIVIQRASLWNS